MSSSAALSGATTSHCTTTSKFDMGNRSIAKPAMLRHRKESTVDASELDLVGMSASRDTPPASLASASLPSPALPPAPLPPALASSVVGASSSLPFPASDDSGATNRLPKRTTSMPPTDIDGRSVLTKPGLTNSDVTIVECVPLTPLVVTHSRSPKKPGPDGSTVTCTSLVSRGARRNDGESTTAAVGFEIDTSHHMFADSLLTVTKPVNSRLSRSAIDVDPK
mmetsp:Transcript_15379/g.48040  ORF Transcript_15379/g.48040 Transcript_15379/m.48040 type:complete len:223 (-) Transcript_15379:1315-1983(-)